MSTRRSRRAQSGIDREKFDFPAAFGSVREGLGTCSGTCSEHLKTVTDDLGGRRLSSARRNARATRPHNHCRIRPAARCVRQAVRNRRGRVLGRDDGSARSATAARVRRKRTCAIIDIGMTKLYAGRARSGFARRCRSWRVDNWPSPDPAAGRRLALQQALPLPTVPTLASRRSQGY